MMNIEIGLQLYSVRNSLQSDYLGTLERVAAVGYTNLELLTRVTEDGLIFGEKMLPAEHGRQLARFGLKALGCHIMPIPGMNWDRVSDSCLETGANALVIPFALFNSRQDVLTLCESMNRAAELCQKKSVQLYYHNHFQEFQKFDGQMVMDIMLENLDPDLVKFEFDSYWAVRGGQDPVAWLRKFGKRCDLLHQKDLPAGVNPVNLFDLTAQNPESGMQDMFKAIKPDQFVEIGTGVLPIAEIIQAGCTYGGARYVIVEQDQTGRTEFESIEISYQNLSRLLQLA